MRDSENSKGNGAAGGTVPHDSRSIGEHGRQIHHDASALAAEVRSTAADLGSYLTDQVKRRPYRTLGTAAGIGYVLGGGLSSRLTVVLLGAVTRLATTIAAREIGARILQSDSTSVQRAPEHTSAAAKE